MGLKDIFLRIKGSVLIVTNIMPEGEGIRRAVKWVSSERTENPDKSVQALINEAVLRFDLSPKDAEFLGRFCREADQDK